MKKFVNKLIGVVFIAVCAVISVCCVVSGSNSSSRESKTTDVNTTNLSTISNNVISQAALVGEKNYNYDITIVSGKYRVFGKTSVSNESYDLGEFINVDSAINAIDEDRKELNTTFVENSFAALENDMIITNVNHCYKYKDGVWYSTVYDSSTTTLLSISNGSYFVFGDSCNYYLDGEWYRYYNCRIDVHNSMFSGIKLNYGVYEVVATFANSETTNYNINIGADTGIVDDSKKIYASISTTNAFSVSISGNFAYTAGTDAANRYSFLATNSNWQIINIDNTNIIGGIDEKILSLKNASIILNNSTIRSFNLQATKSITCYSLEIENSTIIGNIYSKNKLITNNAEIEGNVSARYIEANNSTYAGMIDGDNIIVKDSTFTSQYDTLMADTITVDNAIINGGVWLRSKLVIASDSQLNGTIFLFNINATSSSTEIKSYIEIADTVTTLENNYVIKYFNQVEGVNFNATDSGISYELIRNIPDELDVSGHFLIVNSNGGRLTLIQDGDSLKVALATNDYKTEYYIENLNGEYEILESMTTTGNGVVGDECRADVYLPSEGYYYDTQNENAMPVGIISGTSVFTMKLYYSLYKFQITYELDGGTADNPSYYTMHNDVLLNAPTKEGFIFVGWTFEDQTEPVKAVKIMRTAKRDVTFTAHYVPMPEVTESDPIINRLEDHSEPIDPNANRKIHWSLYVVFGTLFLIAVIVVLFMYSKKKIKFVVGEEIICEDIYHFGEIITVTSELARYEWFTNKELTKPIKSSKMGVFSKIYYGKALMVSIQKNNQKNLSEFNFVSETTKNSVVKEKNTELEKTKIEAKKEEVPVIIVKNDIKKTEENNDSKEVKQANENTVASIAGAEQVSSKKATKVEIKKEKDKKNLVGEKEEKIDNKKVVDKKKKSVNKKKAVDNKKESELEKKESEKKGEVAENSKSIEKKPSKKKTAKTASSENKAAKVGNIIETKVNNYLNKSDSQ